MTRDLTRGNPMRQILCFGIPLLLGYLFQQFYSVVDTAIVGKTLGGDALAAVGSTGSINFLVVGFCTGVCSGFAIPTAQQFGAGNDQELRRNVAGGVWLCAICAAALTAVTVLFCRDILTVMNTPADIYERAFVYIVTIFAGLPAYFLYNYAAGVLRAMGDSRTPVMAGLGCLARLTRGFPVLRMEREDWRWEKRRMANLCLMGLPMGLQYSITAIGSVMIQTAVNGLGTVYVTAVTAANKVNFFFACPFDAMGATMATYGGQNVGAGKWDRLHEGIRSCVLLGAVYSAAALGVLWAFCDGLNMLFLDEASAGLLPLARQCLLTNVLFYFLLAMVNIFRFMIQGMGFSPLATLAGVLEMFARAGVACLVPVFGFSAACFASPAAWIMADAFLIPAYFWCCRRLMTPEKAARMTRKMAHSCS